MRNILLFTIGLFLLPSLSLPQDIQESPYLQELTRRAIAERLFEDRFWHLLLHYRQNIGTGYTSEVDDPGFFMAASGKTDPQAELMATIAQFFSMELVGRSRQPGQCAFIARYHWLKEKLGIDDRRLRPLPCKRFHSWLAQLNPQAISIIFPSTFMNNPASMFGHAFLRIDQKNQTEQTRILAYTINYAATLPPDAGIAYAVKGLFGVYKGYFSTIPYYMKVKEYRDIENRDIWEYQLHFTEEQIQRMLMHAWELGNAYFDYYFFKENCAYHILSLLEVADPQLHLTDQFSLWTIPADAIRLLTQQEGLVGKITYRPARSTQIQRKRDSISRQEKDWLTRITKNPSIVHAPEFKNMAKKRQAFVLDLASDYLRFKRLTNTKKAEEYTNVNKTLLVERSQLKIPSPYFPIKPFTLSPEQGHKTSRAGVGVGWREDEVFEELSIRAAYHDLLDPEIGYSRGTQIELLSASLRHYEKRNQFRVERFTLANLVSLSPMNSLFQTPSWKSNISMETVKTDKCDLCSNGNFNAGIGAAIETQLLNREVYFAFGEVDANVSEAFDNHYRIGGGVTGGLLTSLTDKWRVMLSVSYLGYALGDRSDDLRFAFGQRLTLQQNLALRAEFNHRDDDNQVVATIQAFF